MHHTARMLLIPEQVYQGLVAGPSDGTARTMVQSRLQKVGADRRLNPNAREIRYQQEFKRYNKLAREDGTLAKTPFNFQPFDIRDISVHAGGMFYPAVQYRLRFGDNLFMRAFVDMYEALGMANSERSFDISLAKFKSGWTFFIIPLTSTLDDSCGFELLRSGTTSVRMEFNKAIPSPGVEMIILGEFDQMLMIDYNRHIVSDSNLG